MKGKHRLLRVEMEPLPCKVELGAWLMPPKITLIDQWSYTLVWEAPEWPEGESKMTFHVPPGFVSDGASIPHFTGWRQIFTLLLLALLALCRFGKLRSLRASVAHDHAYAYPVSDRAGCDWMFRQLLKTDGIGFIGRWLAWAGVRLGGWSHFKKEAKPQPFRHDGAWYYQEGTIEKPALPKFMVGIPGDFETEGTEIARWVFEPRYLPDTDQEPGTTDRTPR